MTGPTATGPSGAAEPVTLPRALTLLTALGVPVFALWRGKRNREVS